MTGHVGLGAANLADGRLDDQCHRLRRQRFIGDAVVPVNGTEDVASANAGDRQPLLQRQYGAPITVGMRNEDRSSCAVLVGLGADEQNLDAVAVLGHVLALDGHQLAAAERAGESDQ
ncbi:hypothetical protein D3C87_1731080 [compost metagenome]